nr:MAG TPA: GbX (GbX) [Caudoviricetes sp.]
MLALYGGCVEAFGADLACRRRWESLSSRHPKRGVTESRYKFLLQACYTRFAQVSRRKRRKALASCIKKFLLLLITKDVL